MNKKVHIFKSIKSKANAWGITATKQFKNSIFIIISISMRICFIIKVACGDEFAKYATYIFLVGRLNRL